MSDNYVNEQGIEIIHKKVKHLSPSGIACYRQNKEEFYRRYMITTGREPQLSVMSIGSAFDAYIKSYLHEILFGKNSDPKYTFSALFESQVESHNRDYARIHGKVVFDTYIEQGGAANLLLEMNGSLGEPKFEIDVNGQVESISKMYGNIALTGKPDVAFVNSENVKVTTDWKVNGYEANRNISPMKGYVKCFPLGHCHPDATLNWSGKLIWNSSHYLDHLNIDYATQLTIYSWLFGIQPGEDFIAGIDQICCNNTKAFFSSKHDMRVPAIRVAIHRLKVSPTFQTELMLIINEIWDACHSGHFFKELSLEESQATEKMIKDTLGRKSDFDPSLI